jgi:hypothetical protein
MTKAKVADSARRGLKWHWRGAACVVAASVLAGCGGGSSLMDTASDAGSSIGSRFSQIFGSNSQAVGEPSSVSQIAQNTQLNCPPISIRSGASTLAVAAPGKTAVGNDVRYQATITRTARDCNIAGNSLTARIGIEGRVIVGPAGAPGAVDLPLRVAVVQENPNTRDRVVFTKFYRTSVAMPADGGNAYYSFVAEDVVYPVPTVAASESYIFYIGFDANGMKPEPAPKRPAKPKS